MASRKILVQLDIAAASNLTSPSSGFVGFSAKADGLYQKIGTSPELRLLTSADVQNAILADGSITGAVSQAQIFTMGVKLYNLTQGYIPYASGATKLLSNSPIYTDGTNVGIGTTSPSKMLSIGSGNPFTVTSAGVLTAPNGSVIGTATFNSTGTNLGSVLTVGNDIRATYGIHGGSMGTGMSAMGTKAWNDTMIGFAVRANSATQSADLLQAQNSSGAVLAGITASGGGYYSGNVGIGIVLPDDKLHVIGDAHITGNTYSSKIIVNPTSGIGWYRIANHGGQGGGTVYLDANIDNTNQRLEFTYNIRGWINSSSMVGSVTVTRSMNYNAGPVNSIRISSDGLSSSYLDLYVGTANAPVPFTVYGTNGASFFASPEYNPVVPTYTKVLDLGATDYWGVQTTDSINVGGNATISGNVGIGTNPNDKLDVLGKIRATTDNSSYANFYAVSNGGQFPRAFYGIKGNTGYDNVGFTVANDSNDTTERRAYFSASTLSNAAAATAHSIIIQINPTYGEIYAGQEDGSENLPLYLYSGSNNLLNGLTLRPTSVSGASAINVGIGTMYPTASLHIKEGTATAGTAPIKLTSGTNLTTPEGGAIEFSSSRLYFTPSSTRETVAFLSDITTASHAPITIGEIGSAPNSNGITLIGQVLNLEPASALYGGVVTTGTQTLAGAKTLSSLLTTSAGIANNGSYTQTGTSENIFTGITNINNAISYNYRNFTTGGSSNGWTARWSKLATFQTTTQYNNDQYEILLRSRYYAGKLYVVINSDSNVTTNLVDFRFISDFVGGTPDIRIYRSQDSTCLSTWDVYIYNTSYSSYEYAENNTRSANSGGGGKVVTFYQNTYEDPPVGSIAVSYGPYFNGIVSATGITSSGTINFSSLTASKVVFTDGSKNLTSTGIGTASQFIKGDGSLDSNTYLTTGTAIISGSGVDGRITFWNGTNSLSSSAYLTWDDTNNRINTNFINLMYGFKLGTSTTAGYVLTTDANGNGTWQAPQGGGNIVSSVFGRTGTVVAVNGDYNTSQVTENTNLYFTDSRARVAISLTINGQSGASTYNNSTGILNVPNYSLTGLGGVPKTRTITINGEVQDLSANRTWNVGDLLSTGSYSNPSWLTSLAWSKITNKPTTFYGYGITETPWTSYLPLSGGTLTGDLNSKRIICQSIIGDDYNTGAIEILGSYDNTFYPTLGFDQPSNFAASIQLRGAIDFRLYAQGGTTYANLTTNKLISASLQIGTSTTSGYVLTADANGNGTWQAPGGSITGSGVDGRLTFWSGTNSLSSTSNLEWNSTTKNLGVTGGVVANGISSISVSTNSLLTNSFSLIATTTAGYVLTADAYGNGTWQAPTGSLSGFVPYTGATQDVNIGTFGIAAGYAFIGGLQLFNNYIQENEVGIHYNDVYALAAFDTLNLIYSYGSNKLRISDSGDVSIDKSLTIGNTNTSSYTDGGYLSVQTPSASYASFDFYSKDTFDDFGIVQIIANPEEGIILRARSNDNSSSSTLEIRNYDFSFYTNSLKRLEIAQNGSINAFGNTITSTGGFIGNASTATKLQTARTITIGNQSLSFDGTANLTYSLANIGVPTGSGVDGRITFWSGTNSLSSNSNLTWDNTNSRLTVYSIFSVGSFKLGTNATAGYVLTTDANGNGTWQAPPTGGGGSYTLPTASASVLGCVKIGSGITISSGVISVSTNYEAPLTFSSGLTRSGNAISVTSGTYVPFVGADRDVNLASYSIYAYDFLVYSDINLKCNIEDIKMKKLDINYKQFEYKTSRGEKRYGVIAQELLSIAPEFVSESNNSYAVKYTDLLIYEVAQLKEEVKQLKSLLCR